MRTLTGLIVVTMLGIVSLPSAALAAPDLELSNFYTIVSGTTVTYHLTVCNVGNDPAAGYNLDLYYHRAGSPNCNTTPDRRRAMSGLASGNCVVESFTRTSAPSGSFTGWARADGSCTVTETAENNNNASYAYNVNLPDLQLTTFYTTTSATTVTFHATVCNNGDSITGAFDLEIYYQRSTAPGCTTAHSQKVTISGLASGNCTIRTFTRTGTPAGVYTGWALVDSSCKIKEMDESNNHQSTTYAVGLPDLALTTFYAVVSGGSVTFHATVCNLGEDTSTPFQLELYYNRGTAPTCATAHSQTLTLGGMASGICSVHTFTRNGTPAGNYHAWARAEANCVITEMDEGNNNDSTMYTVGLPDLTVSSFNAAVNYNSVTYSATVCNLGEATSASFALELYYNRGAAPICTTPHSQTQTIAGMASGTCSVYTFTRSNAPLGSFNAWIRVDANCVVAEGVEGNNNDSDSYTVSSLPPDAGPDLGPDAGPDLGPDLGPDMSPDLWIVDAAIGADASEDVGSGPDLLIQTDLPWIDMIAAADSLPGVDASKPVEGGAEDSTTGDAAAGDSTTGDAAAGLDTATDSAGTDATNADAAGDLAEAKDSASDAGPDDQKLSDVGESTDAGTGDGGGDDGSDDDGPSSHMDFQTIDAVAGDGKVEDAQGCDCTVSRARAGDELVLMLALALLLVIRRRRK